MGWKEYWSQDFERLRGELEKTPATLVELEPGNYNQVWKRRTNVRSTYSATVEPDLGAQPGDRNLIVCIDGTWNSPESRTNVFLLSELLPNLPGRQAVIYYNGVGVRHDQGAALDLQRARQSLQETLRKEPVALEMQTLKLLGGAGGKGAAAIRRRAYFDLVCNYRPGDRLFLFGFSRGAAIARTLANTIEKRGIPKSLTAVFSKNPNGPDAVSALSDSETDRPLNVHMFGVWDTVPRFGITGFGNLFKDLSTPGNLLSACHLVAIDERRKPFTPRLLEPGPNVEEIWFPGVHTSVGGGYMRPTAAGDGEVQDFGISDLSLRFMMRRAEARGAIFADSVFDSLRDDPLGPIEAKNPWFYPEGDRAIRVGAEEEGPRPLPRLHWSVAARRDAGLSPPYDPAPLAGMSRGSYDLVEDYRDETESARPAAPASEE